MRQLIFLLFLFFTVTGSAQYESNWWYFGDSLSIDFKKGKAAIGKKIHLTSNTD